MTPAHHANARKRLSNAMRSVLERMDRAGHMPMHGLTPQQARAAYAAGAGVLDISPPHLTRVQEIRKSVV